MTFDRRAHRESIREEFRLLGIIDGYRESMSFAYDTMNENVTDRQYSKEDMALMCHKMFLTAMEVYLNGPE